MSPRKAKPTPAGRVFLGWEGSLPSLAAGYFVESHVRDGGLDLGRDLVVASGGRAGRTLLGYLIDACDARGLRFFPPTVVSPGELPERLYSPTDVLGRMGPSGPSSRRGRSQRSSPPARASTLATAWDRTSAVIDAIRTLTDDERAVLALDAEPGLAPRERNSDFRLVSQATSLLARWDAVVDLGLSTEAIARKAKESGEDDEHARWRILALLDRRYREQLLARGRADLHHVRQVALSTQRVSFPGQIFLVGLPELPLPVFEFLQSLAWQVIPMVYAPEEWGDRFDGWGRVRPESWCHDYAALPSDLWTMAGGPADAAAVTADRVAERAPRIGGRDVTLGVAAVDMLPFLKNSFQLRGAKLRWASGTPIYQTGPFRLWHCLRDWLNGETADAIPAMLRHPDIFHYLMRKGLPASILEAVDGFLDTHLVVDWSEEALEGLLPPRPIQAVRAALAELRACFAPGVDSLARHVASLRACLQCIYAGAQGHWEDPQTRLQLEAIERMGDLLDLVAGSDDRHSARVTAGEAMEWLMDELQSTTIPEPTDGETVEGLGWLELLADDAPELIVTGLEEGVIPGRDPADGVLAEPLRLLLDPDDVQRRFARDAYTLEALRRSRRFLHFVVRRFDADQQPLLPSRLLLGSDSERLCTQWSRFLDNPADRGLVERISSSQLLPVRSRFAIPEPDESVPQPTTLRVTDFRRYLACPYRFYLERVLRLRSGGGLSREMDASTFGTLIHLVLSSFGQSDLRDSTDAAKIRDGLEYWLAEITRDRFGHQPRAAVRVQLEQIKIRIERFAQQQAELRQSGWKIAYVEREDEDLRFDFPVDDATMAILGRIDRIDVHEESGNVRIIDYKTSDKGKTPEQAHLRKGEWIDLQLPLYRFLAKELDFAAPHELAYLNLPKNQENSGLQKFEWDSRLMADAEETARDVVRKIRARQFWPPSDLPAYLAGNDAFSAICQTGIRPS